MGTEKWTLTLNKYQRDNLLWLINICGYPSPTPHHVAPFGYANTGDWIGEIAQMLAPGEDPVLKESDRPNLTPDDLRKAIDLWFLEKAKDMRVVAFRESIKQVKA